MATFDGVALAEKIASAKAIKRADDESVAFKIANTDTTATTNKIVIGTGGTNLVHTYNSTVTTYDLGATAYDTLGELVDFINNTSAFNSEAVIVDGRRANWADNSFVAGTYDYTAAAKDVVFDSNGTSCNFHSVSLQREDLPSLNTADSGYMNRIYEIVAKETNASGTATINVYSCVGTTETLIYSRTHATGGTEVTYDLGASLGLDAGVGGRLLVEMVEQTAGGYIEIRGRTFKVA